MDLKARAPDTSLIQKRAMGFPTAPSVAINYLSVSANCA
jgi:hypothetical protein